MQLRDYKTVNKYLMNSGFFYKSAPFSKEIVSEREIAKDPENIKYAFVVFTNIQCFSKYIEWLENNGVRATIVAINLSYGTHIKLEWGHGNNGFRTEKKKFKFPSGGTLSLW